MIKEIDTIDISVLLSAYQELENGMIWYESADRKVNVFDTHLKRQTSLQYRETEDPWISSVGRLRADESMCFNLNPYFKDTVFEMVINKYNLARTRFLWVPAYSCYSMHHDSTPRIHIPLVTNPNCYFVFKKGIVEHLPCGKVYEVNTTEDHTFINCSPTPRLHLMGIM